MNVVADALPKAPNHRARYTFIDVGRAFAAVCVLVQHSLEASGFQGLERGDVATSWLNLGETGVAIFFIVSGFIIPASVKATPTLVNFCIRRVLRIYPLYLVVLFLTLAFALGVVGIDPPPVLPTAVSHLFIAQSWLRMPNFVGGSWTLLIEFAWYGAFAAAFFVFRETGQRFLILSFVGLATISVLAALFYGGFPFGRFSILTLCFVGYMYFLYFDGKLSRSEFVKYSVAYNLLIYANLFVGFYVFPSNAHGAPSFICVFVSWSIAILFFAWLFFNSGSAFANSQLLARIGEISFSIYLLHSLFIMVLHQTVVTGLPFVVLLFVLTGAGSIVTYRYVERPGIALSRKLTTPPSRAARAA